MSFFGFVIFFNRAKMFPCEKLNQFLSVFVAPTRLKKLFFGCTSTFPLNQILTKFVAPTRLKNFCLTSHSIFVSIRNRHISSFTGNQFFTFILKKMKVFYARYETFLHTFTSNFVRQVLPKFLPLNCGRKITDFKEWSKIRVCCFF